MRIRNKNRFMLISVIGLCSAIIYPQGNANAQAAAMTNNIQEHQTNIKLDDLYDSVFVLKQSDQTGKVVKIEELAKALSEYDVIFYGEFHRHPGVHLQEQKFLSALYAINPNLMVSLEQFETDTQGVVDDYLNGKVGEVTLKDKGRAWDNYDTSYRPLMLFAKQHKLPVIAAEAPTWAISCIGQKGLEILDKFTPEDRQLVAKDIHVTEGAYKDKYYNFLGGGSGHGESNAGSEAAKLKAYRSFSAQIARDDTMAQSIYDALNKYKNRKIIHYNGNFHSASFLGTVERLKLRSPNLRIAVINPIEATNIDNVSYSNEEIKNQTAIQIVYPLPESFVKGEDSSEWVANLMAKRKSSQCKY